MNENTKKLTKLLKEIITEYNETWKDISINVKTYRVSAGYNCFNLKESDIITLASGLDRKGVK